MPSSRSDTQLLEKDASFDAWMIQKLRSDWNAHEFGGLLTPLKLAEARTRFSHQETLIKVRLLLSLLSIRYDEVNGVSSKKEVRALLEITEKDGDEWVKVISGIVKQFLELDTNGQSSDSYHHAQLENTVLKVIQAVAIPSKRHKNSNLMILDDVFTFENGLLNTSLRSQTTPTAAIHFTVSGDKDDGHDKDEDVDVSPVKKPLYRPQIPRPSGLVPSSIASTSSITRLNQTSKFSMGKKNLSELSSEIRRKADAGRFKRQRSRISMIDINEVKQIESEKAQKAEERKKQKLAAKEKEKEKLAKEKEREKIAASEKTGTGHGLSVTNNDEHAAIAADIFAMHHQLGQDESISHYSQQQLQMEEMTDMNVNQQLNEEDYIQDGTQALLNAAFHSTQDIMKEVVNQQNQQIPEQQQYQQQSQQAPYQDLYRSQQQMQMHHLVPPQQQYQGFEPEDASLNNTNTSGMPIAYNGYNYGPAAGYYGDQFGNYGNAFNSTGFVNSAMGQQDTNMGLPPLANRQMGYDPTQSQNQQQNNGGYMSGSGEYWR